MTNNFYISRKYYIKDWKVFLEDIVDKYSL